MRCKRNVTGNVVPKTLIFCDEGENLKIPGMKQVTPMHR